MACEAEQAALTQAISERNSAAIAVENSATVIDQANAALQQAITVGMANVEAMAFAQQMVDLRQQQMADCLSGGSGPQMPMMAADKKAKDHCLPDCRDVLAAMKEEISGYFTKIIRKVRGGK